MLKIIQRIDNQLYKLCEILLIINIGFMGYSYEFQHINLRKDASLLK